MNLIKLLEDLNCAYPTYSGAPRHNIRLAKDKDYLIEIGMLIKVNEKYEVITVLLDNIDIALEIGELTKKIVKGINEEVNKWLMCRK